MQEILTPNTEVKSIFTLPIDEQGYLINLALWDEHLAKQLAAHAGLTSFNNTHLQVITFLRDYYQRLGFMPPTRRVCRQLKIEGHNIKAMFGSCLTAWKIAGLPDPGEEARAHMR